jgi:hypothetical protein
LPIFLLQKNSKFIHLLFYFLLIIF